MPQNADTPAAPLNQPTGWIAYGDAVRLWGTIAVIVQHVAQIGMRTHDEVAGGMWWYLHLANSAAKWAVPLFVMLSGAIMLDPNRDEPLSTFYRKRFTRVGIPLVFFCGVYLCVSAYQGIIQQREVIAYQQQLELSGDVAAVAPADPFDPNVPQFSPTPPDANVRWRLLADNLLDGRPYYHMHFLFIIVGLYLFTPMLRQFVKQSTAQTRWLVITFALVLACFGEFAMIMRKSNYNAFNLFVPYIGYFLLGYQLRHLPARTLRTIVAWALLAVTTVMMSAGTWVLNHTSLLATLLDASRLEGGAHAKYFYHYFNPVIVLMSIAAFIAIAGTFDRPRPWSGWLMRLAKWSAPATLGIYLVHPALLFGLNLATIDVLHLPIPGSDDHTPMPLSLPLGVLLIFALSWLITEVIRSVPLLRRVVG
ncbi:MAG: hypothetical protein CMJ49_00620 [Planctomycetaceae bacterium]|nr:hypothetical protein [Planctomycetaceae bacterium]